MRRPRDAAASVRDEDRLLVQACLLYYEHGYIQERVARQLGISRWKVGRLLQAGRDRGIVDIQIRHPNLRAHDLEFRLGSEFPSCTILVVPTPAEDATVALEATAHVAADLVANLHPRPELLGVSWGRTMDAVATRLKPGWARDLHVVQLNGALNTADGISSGSAVTERIADTAGGRATVLPVPAIVEHESTRRALENDRWIGATLRLADEAPVALFGLGAIGPDSVHLAAGYVTSQELRALQRAGAVGDIVGRFVSVDGRIVDSSIDARTIGVSLEQLAAKDRRIAVATGRRKRDIVIGALRAGVCNVLIIDEHLAQAILETVEPPR